MGARRCYKSCIGLPLRGAVAQLGARLDGIEEVVGSNPIGSTKFAEDGLLRLHPAE